MSNFFLNKEQVKRVILREGRGGAFYEGKNSGKQQYVILNQIRGTPEGLVTREVIAHLLETCPLVRKASVEYLGYEVSVFWCWEEQ